MKPTDFITEDHNIVQAVVEMHDDHEVQMAREQCYNAASNAIELHRMLKHMSERQGLEGWVQEKITLANDYLRQVKEWLEYEMMNQVKHQTMDSVLPVGEDASTGTTSAGSMATNTQTQYAYKPKRSTVPASQRRDKLTIAGIKKERDPYAHLSSPETIRRNQG